MSLELGLVNLWFYSLQTGILILGGGLLAWIFRLRDPGGVFFYWRLLLAGCLILVFQPGVPEPLADSASIPLVESLILPATPVKAGETSQAANVYPLLGGLLVSGIALRLIWLGVGFYRLHRMRRRTRRLTLPLQLHVLTEEMGVSPQLRVSSEVSGPITFGWLRPVVVFPESFGELDGGMQKAIACHELLHVKRRDWLWNTIEEIVRTIFWFHPGFHWLIGRIQLTREQVVDRQAVAVLGSRKIYLKSMVEIAKWGNPAPSLPAPLFLKECQLSCRMRLLLQLREVKMSKMKSAISMTACFALLAATGWWSLAALPLTAFSSSRLQDGEPAVEEPVQVGIRVMASKLVHRVDPKYPPDLESAHPLDDVILSALIGKYGVVQQVRVVRGNKDHPAVNSATLDAVKQWRYKPFMLDGKPVPVRTAIVVRFPANGITVPANGITARTVDDKEIRSAIEKARKETAKAEADIERARKDIEKSWTKVRVIAFGEDTNQE